MELERITKIDIGNEMKKDYIDYSMSVIVSRALPDVRDGLKPVHRRVLFGMHELGNTSTSPTKKCARIVGEVMGKYHPHGDSSIYGTLVRMAQPWAMRYLLVEKQGNFGSIDGDGPAAMRYTEARMHKLAEEMLADINKNTVDFQNNFDDTLQEPLVLPTKIPNLLINGASGIAVGMATNMAPHNLSDSIDAIDAYIDNKDIDIEDLIKIIKAPDFPTGGSIYGYAGVRDAYLTGKGRIVIRAKANIESDHDKDRIVITEIPYMVNKSEMIMHIANLTKEGKIEGISELRDESNSEGIRVVIEIKRDANASVVLNKLYKFTELQSSFSANNIALVKGRPKLLTLKDIIENFVEHRMDVVTRRTKFELEKAEARAHILEGLIIASDNIDEVIAIIKANRTPDKAIENLMNRFSLSEIQARAIVEMRLRQLTGLEQDKLRQEYNELMIEIERLKELLASEDLRMKLIKTELLEIKEKYGDERRTEIVYSSEEFNPEDFYADDDMVITISHLGYIKRTALAEFKVQNRGGVGSKGSATRDEDFIEYIYPASMHNYMLFFTQRGRCYWLKVYDIPEGTKNSKGRAIQNMLNIEKDDKATAFITTKQLQDESYNTSHYLMFCTKNGVVKKTSLSAYARPRQNGVNAITIREDDKVIEVALTDGKSEIILATKMGRAIRFNEEKVREMGRTATGVRGVSLNGANDEVIGMISVEDIEKETIMVISEKGFGKRSTIDDYRITNRGGKGVKTLNITDKTGNLVAIKCVTDENDLMIINKSGVVSRMKVTDFRVMGRVTQGVRVINLEKRKDEISSVCKVLTDDEELPIDDENENSNDENENNNENMN